MSHVDSLTQVFKYRNTMQGWNLIAKLKSQNF